MSRLKLLVTLSCLGSFANAENRVVLLKPPILNEKSIAAKVPCVRPMREGTFNISSQTIGEKFIVHCYGHGGCGWTTFMGSVERAIELLQRRYPDPSSAPPIRVIGAGCMGLCSAIELVRKGYSVTGITAKEIYEIPSWNAAGYFALVSVKVAPEEEEAVKKINYSTFASYQEIERGQHPYFSPKAVRFLPVYCSRDTHSGVEELEEQGVIPPVEIVDLDFGNGVVHRGYKKFMTYFFDVTTLMREMHDEVARLKIPTEIREVENFDETEERIVFNCTGLGGGDLAKDYKMIPVRGHLAMLGPDAGQEHMDYMIYSKMDSGEYVYLFPRTLFISSEDGSGT
jgi:D-amino-acid oxidase